MLYNLRASTICSSWPPLTFWSMIPTLRLIPNQWRNILLVLSFWHDQPSLSFNSSEKANASILHELPVGTVKKVCTCYSFWLLVGFLTVNAARVACICWLKHLHWFIDKRNQSSELTDHPLIVVLQLLGKRLNGCVSCVQNLVNSISFTSFIWFVSIVVAAMGGRTLSC